MLPQHLINDATTTTALALLPDNATASTYRVVRATAEQECKGAFDSVNAYDDAIVSLGLATGHLVYSPMAVMTMENFQGSLPT